MKFVAYLASVPPSKKSQHKSDLLRRFVGGVQAAGDHGVLATRPQLVDADVAFIQGWPQLQANRLHTICLEKKYLIFKRETTIDYW